MPNSSYKILVVDDLPDWRKTLAGLLTDAGFQVQIASSENDALELLKTNRFDLAVLDIRLDESDEDNIGGLDLAAEIKRQSPAMKIVIITGYGTPDRMKRALEPDTQGQKLAEDYIPKPQSEELAHVVQRILARQ